MKSADLSLARRMPAGKEPVFDEFFDGHFGRIYRFALRRLNHDEAAAEEIATRLDVSPEAAGTLPVRPLN
jgi:DNA-directed RNA polymerase specialized sigma24 family protein